MCGIAGIISRSPNIDQKLNIAEQVQKHRGPNKQSTAQYKIGPWSVGLGHQRLSIIDLSEGGNQPMVSKDGLQSIVFNGEIYNYKEISSELTALGQTFRSHSDTEVLLAALGHWGLEGAQPRFNGMWAYAYLDSQKQSLILSRDRAGVKPLYYYCTDQEIYFASEIKTILAMTGRKFDLNEKVVGAFLLQSLSDISSETMFRDIHQLPAGHAAEIDLSKDNLSLNIKEYWQAPFETSSILTMKDAVEKVRSLFLDAVRLRLRSDVPVGVLLSGGIDSSAIACAMHSMIDQDVDMNLLSVVSDNKDFDESPFIDKVGAYLKRKIHKVSLSVDPKNMLDLLKTVSWFNDEPIGGFSTLLHYLLMGKAKELNITVILSGQGADELLCGYKKYLGFYVQYLLRRGEFIKAMMVLDQFRRQGTVINQFNVKEAKRYLPKFLRPSEIDIRGERLLGYSPVSLGLPSGANVSFRQKLDLEQFSVPVLTHYEDRMSMALAREIRLPFLDYRLMETLIPMSINYKLANGWTKYIFREAMKDLMPPEIAWRKDKQGFINPQSEWLKNDLKDSVLGIFENNSLIYQKLLVNKKNLLLKYGKYCDDKNDSGGISFRDIFNPLSLEIWLREYEKYIK